MPRRPSRGPSPVYYGSHRPDLPPMPQGYQHHIAVEQARMLNRSLKGSVSSGSTNLRTDSDPPSSEIASPPTPKDGLSMEALIGPGRSQIYADLMTGEPMYYDGSEHFASEQFVESQGDHSPTGFVTRIKTIIEERGSAEPVSKDNGLRKAMIPKAISQSEVPDVIELPASPVPRRITRDLILEALEPASTTDVLKSTDPPSAFRRPDAAIVSQTVAKETGDVLSLANKPDDQRYSILSQTGSSVLDSSTLDFAVRYSIPMAASAGLSLEVTSNTGIVPATPTSLERSTEDGMSELLAGYQHTESKQDCELESQSEGTYNRSANPDEQIEKRSNHSQKASDEQSFKSCTDMPESASTSSEPVRDQDPKSVTPSSVKREQSVKDSDVHSFRTAKDAVTPDRVASMPPSRLPSSSLATSVPLYNRPVSETPLSGSPPVIIRKQQTLSLRESSLSTIASKFRAGSKPSVKQGSMSVSGSSSTLSATPQPPIVPPRESSSSKEAQRYQAVASFLIRQLPSRLNKSRKSVKEDLPKASDGSEDATRKHDVQVKEPSETDKSSDLPSNTVRTPEKALSKHSVLPDESDTASVVVVNRNRSRTPDSGAGVLVSQKSTGSPIPGIAEPSSVYSPQNSSLQSRVHSSPVGIASSPSCGRRDSQTTTHLVWPGKRTLNKHSFSASESHLPLPNIQENTTTDLRLSGYGYKYVGPAQHLPDVKEESHEDSSLNTSASNLKNASFRYPFGGPLGSRASVDDAVMISARSSSGSNHREALGSALGQSRGLPSMHFSQINLFEKLNEELGLRNSRSLEDVLHRPEQMVDTDLRRPASAIEVREKFCSIVANLEMLGRSRDSSPATDAMNLSMLSRAQFPQQLIAELEQLTIPSVGVLTQRISEMLPSLREYYKFGEPGEFVEEEAIMEHALEEIHDVAPTQKRSSARLRPVAGSPHMVVINDALYDELTSKEKQDVVRDGGDDSTGDHGAGEADLDAKEQAKNNTLTQPHHNHRVAQTRIPSPVYLRPRSQTVGAQDFRSSGESALSSRWSLRSFVSTPTATETRPWNSDKNYPWATATDPAIDISLPQPIAIRNSPRAGPSHLRNALSEAVTTSSLSSAQTATASPFGSAADSNSHARLHRFSTLGRSGDQPHAVGERYPTSALTPPTAIFRDHYTASDISDDDDFTTLRRSKIGLLKRFSSARYAATDPSTRITRSKINPHELASPESTKQPKTSTIEGDAIGTEASTAKRHTFRNAEGMRATDYHRERLLGHLKRLWRKGGSLIRKLSRRN